MNIPIVITTHNNHPICVTSRDHPATEDDGNRMFVEACAMCDKRFFQKLTLEHCTESCESYYQRIVKHLGGRYTVGDTHISLWMISV